MQIKKIPISEVPFFTKRDKDYVNEVPALRPFFKYPVSLDSFQQVIEDKQKEPIDRGVLVEVLKRQHRALSHPATARNIESLLSQNTFTIVTAHQPSLFTGPLYYVFKIISIINLAKQLNGRYPGFHFVPVFITSGEDHDFEEVNHLHLFGKKLAWASGETGPVGLMSTASLRPVLDELRQVLGDSENGKHIFQIIERAHTENGIYADAAFQLAHELFKNDGLVVLNTNEAQLKKGFSTIIRQEILEKASLKPVQQTISELEAIGYPAQAAPREINFFYLGPQSRERIVEENGQYRVLNTDLHFSPSEMEQEIEQHPERFSPNVVMRPLYQEKILPNLAYIGGGGELAYWLERKRQFEFFGVNFPMLVRRDSALWVDSASAKRLEKMGLQLEELWVEQEQLVKHFIAKNSETGFSLEAEQTALERLFHEVATKAKAIDPTLEGAVLAEFAKAKKGLENMETRLVRAEKQRHEQAISQLLNLREKLFPGNGLQERHDNFLPFYIKHGEAFFEILKENFDPLEKGFLVIGDG